MTLAASQKPRSKAAPRTVASSSCKVPSEAFDVVGIADGIIGVVCAPSPPSPGWALSMLTVSTRRGRPSRRPRGLG